MLERHPALRVAFLESGCGWLPYWLWRMDEHWETAEGVDGEPQLPMKPSDYFQPRGWISGESDEPYVGAVLDFIGEDRLLFASDYPHLDHTMVAMPIADVAKRRILWDNPATFYRL